MLLGLVSVWLMVGPDPALAPVMPPVIVPTIQEKVLGMDAVRAIFRFAPLQVLTVAKLVPIGLGVTVTVIIDGIPVHDPTVAVGVTIYSTVPDVELLGLSNT